MTASFRGSVDIISSLIDREARINVQDVSKVVLRGLVCTVDPLLSEHTGPTTCLDIQNHEFHKCTW